MLLEITRKVLPRPKEMEKVGEAVMQAMSKIRTKSRGKYNSYTPWQRAQIGQYAAENVSTKAAVHFSSLWKLNINESTSRRLNRSTCKNYMKLQIKRKRLRKASDSRCPCYKKRILHIRGLSITHYRQNCSLIWLQDHY